MTDLNRIQALTFDVGGTVFDWRGGLEAELRSVAASKGAEVDVPRFALDWRSGMFRMLARVRSGELPWMNADDIHRVVLDDVLEKHGTLSLSASERDDLNEVWHSLKSWPDAAEAIERLRSRYTVVVLTVLSWSIAVDCSRHNGISWDGIISCEFLGDYKPDPAAYEAALKLLRLDPSRAMMVAAHQGDLRAAMSVGMKSAYVHREGESSLAFNTPGQPQGDKSDFDIVADDFPDLADKLLA